MNILFLSDIHVYFLERIVKSYNIPLEIHNAQLIQNKVYLKPFRNPSETIRFLYENKIFT